jgi:hypothetical protein
MTSAVDGGGWWPRQRAALDRRHRPDQDAAAAFGHSWSRLRTVAVRARFYACVCDDGRMSPRSANQGTARGGLAADRRAPCIRFFSKHN